MTARNSRRILLIIVVCCLLPWAAAEIVFRWLPPQDAHSYGELLIQPALPAQQHWQLIAHPAPQCNSPLQTMAQQLYNAQGRDRERLEVRPCASPLAGAPWQNWPTGLYLIDPHGNAVLRYRQRQLDSHEGRQKVLREIGAVLRRNPGLG